MLSIAYTLVSLPRRIYLVPLDIQQDPDFTICGYKEDDDDDDDSEEEEDDEELPTSTAQQIQSGPMICSSSSSNVPIYDTPLSYQPLDPIRFPASATRGVGGGQPSMGGAQPHKKKPKRPNHPDAGRARDVRPRRPSLLLATEPAPLFNIAPVRRGSLNTAPVAAAGPTEGLLTKLVKPKQLLTGGPSTPKRRKFNAV